MEQKGNERGKAMIATEDIIFTTGFTLLSIGYFLAVKADKEKSKILNKITGTGEGEATGINAIPVTVHGVTEKAM